MKCLRWGLFLALALAAILTTAGCSRGPDAIGENRGYGNPVPCPTDPVTAEAIQQKIDAFQAKRGVKLAVSDLPKAETITYDLVKESAYTAVAFYIGVLDEEMEKYPGTGFAKAQVSVVGFTDNLKLNDRAATGVANFENHSILLHFAYEYCDAEWAAATFHHEVFHHLDVVAGIAPDWPGEPSARSMYNYRPGLVSTYAGTSPLEDKAETFSALLMKNWIAKVETWAAADSILARKINLIKNAVPALGPEYGNEYWTKIREGRFLR